MGGTRLSGGLFVALVTPFDEKEEVDLGAFRAIVEYVIAGGADGLIAAGTTGEAHALSFEERRGLWQTAVRQAGSRAVAAEVPGETKVIPNAARQAAHDRLALVEPPVVEPLALEFASGAEARRAAANNHYRPIHLKPHVYSNRPSRACSHR